MSTDIQLATKPRREPQITLAAGARQQMKDYAGTFAAEFGVLACQILVYKLAARFLGVLGFSEYAVARRTLSLLQPAVLLGIGVGLPRYIAIAEASGDLHRVRRFFGAAAWCITAGVAVVTVASIVWRDWFSYLFFGSKEYAPLVPALSLMLAGLSMHALCYGFLRGRMAISRANALNLVNLGFVPLIVFLWFHNSVRSALWGLGIGWTAIAIIALIWLPLGAIFRNHARERKELLAYGFQRVPGDFILMALLALPAIFAAHASGIQIAGYVAFGVSITNMIASMFSPVGIILLPKVSRNIKNSMIAKMRKEIHAITWSAVLIPVALIVMAEIVGPFLIRIYLGGEHEAAVRIVRTLVVAALPLSIYYALRSVIDAFHERAVNTVNLFFSLAVFLGLALLAFLWRARIETDLWSFVLATALLAMLTTLEVRSILRKEIVPAPELGLLSKENLEL